MIIPLISFDGIVSCVDIVAVADRDSVVALGGSSWVVPLGRRDSTTASLTAVNTNLPSPTLNLVALITAFANKGVTENEMVALSGAHTIAQARCTNFRARLYNENSVNTSFATSLKASGGDNNLSLLDLATPTTFDNVYFNNLLTQNCFLHSDQQLFSGGSADSQVRSSINNATAFAVDFANPMVKMGNLSPLTGSSGQIRKNCGKVN